MIRLTILFLLSSLSGYSTNFYISPTGNDATSTGTTDRTGGAGKAGVIVIYEYK